MIEDIKQIIKIKFTANEVEVIDQSKQHYGHSAFKEGEITHIKLIVESEQLKQISLVKAHQQIYQAIDKYINNPLHAISIKIK
jgi:BolA protein